MVNLDLHDVQVSGITLSVGTAGPEEAPTLVLLHGWPESMAAFRSVVPLLADEYFLIVPDQRGFGQSDKPEGIDNYRMHLLIADVLGLIEWRGRDEIGLVGHDMGAAVAWSCATVMPNRITRMVTMCAPHPNHFHRVGAGNVQQIYRAFYAWLLNTGKKGERLLASNDFNLLSDWAFGKSKGVTEDMRAAYRAEWAQPGAFHAMAEWYRAIYNPDMFNPDLPLQLPNLTVPTRYLHGENDLAFVPEMASGSGDFVDADYDEQVVPNTTHWMLHEQPEAVVALVKGWMANSQ